MTNALLVGLSLAGALAVALVALAAIRRFRAQADRPLQQDRRFEATFEQAAVGIAHLDPQGRWIRVNARYCELTGYSRDELMGLTVDDLTHPLDRPDDQAVRQTLTDGKIDSTKVEKRYIRKDGKVIWVNATRSTVRDAEGRPDFFVALVEEITARKEAEAQLITGEAQYRAIFDSAVEAMAVIDAAGIVQSVNPSVKRTFGYSPDELLGRNIKMLMPEAIAQHHDGYLSRYRDTGVKGIIGTGREVVGQRKDGSRFPLDVSVAEWQRDGATFFTGVMRDVSARKDTEAALFTSEGSLLVLQNELAHLARVNDLGEMAAAIAHEINQPLTAIVNYLNNGLLIAGEGYSEDGFAETEQLIRDASEQGLRAGQIVRRLREFIGQGSEARTVELADQLAETAMALALIDARSSGIAIDRIADAGDAKIEVDPIQIQQVLVNLLRNAVDALKHAPPGVEPKITISTSEHKRTVEFTITDNGPGIPPELAGRLFEPFVTTKANGMGMGLSVCRRLIEAHGGAIDAESIPGEGATFKFYLPRYGPA